MASVVNKALFTCGVECVTTWSSNSSAFPACFLQKLLPPSLFAISVGCWQSLSMVFHCLRSLLSALLCLFRAQSVVLTFFSMPPPTWSTNNSLSMRLPPQDTCIVHFICACFCSVQLWHAVISRFNCRHCGPPSRKLSAYHHGVNSREPPPPPSSAASAKPPSCSTSTGGMSTVGIGSGSSARLQVRLHCLRLCPLLHLYQPSPT